MMRHLRETVNISWKEKITNKVILEKAGLYPVADILIQRHLRWIGHIVKVDLARLPRQLLYSQLLSYSRTE